MRKQEGGCEIEAVGIIHKISMQKREFSFFKTSDRVEAVDQKRKQVADDDVEGARYVLKGVNCRAKPWEILAVAGPNGSGKTSLLKILAGQVSPARGSVLVDKNLMQAVQLKKISGYVSQRDTLFPLLTVEETLLFSAKLRLRLPQPEVISRVRSLIRELGLEKVSTARVGDKALRGGISGGEMRRVSIGVDVIHNPKLLILDEPTSGLDSTSALQIIDMLKTMAETRGRTIILSIHQPGFRIVKLFSSILLLDNGLVMHHGAADQLVRSLSEMGIQLPSHVDAVEFAIDSMEAIKTRQDLQLVQKQQEDEDEDAARKLSIHQLLRQANGRSTEVKHDFANSIVKETLILSHRFSKNIFRSRELFACRMIQMLISGLMLGSVFHNVGDDLVGAEERVGLFAFILTLLLSCSSEALPVFLQEREILFKETSNGSYRVSSYAIANSLIYLPFLMILTLSFSVPLYWLVGLNQNVVAFIRFLLIIWFVLYTANSVVVCIAALAPNFIIGNSLISCVMGSFFLFSGYFISRHEIPTFWVFMHYVSLFKYPFESLLINEFSHSRACLDYISGTCVIRGEDVTREEGFAGKSPWRNVFVMLCFIFAYRSITFLILSFRCSSPP